MSVASEMAETIKYNACLSKILKNCHGGHLRLATPAMKILSAMLEHFNGKLIFYTVKAIQSRKWSNNSISTAGLLAAETCLNEAILLLAVTEAQRALALHRMGILVFKPLGEDDLAKKAMESLRRKQERLARDLSLEYLPSVQEVFNTICPGEEIEMAVLKHVSQTIRNIALKLIQQAQGIAGEKAMIMPVHIKEAVNNIMGCNIAPHANTEATRFLFMFEKGFIEPEGWFPAKR